MSEPRRRRARRDTAQETEHMPRGERERTRRQMPDVDEASDARRSWDRDTVWDDTPETADDFGVPDAGSREILATNRTIRLSCTLAAMSALFGLFLCFAEQESRAIRHYAVSSTALRVMNLIAAAVLAVIGAIFGGIPLMGFVIQVVCWLLYGCICAMLAVVRVRMMLHAWNGVRFDVPGIGEWLEKKYV